MRRRHRLALFCHLALSLASPAQAFSERVDFSASDDFSEASVIRGIRATEEQCRSLPGQAVWARTEEGEAECIKYWAHGLTEHTRRAIVFLHGDRLNGNKVLGDHAKLDGKRLAGQATAWGKRLDAPYIYLGRPGTHGSSGDHKRRRTREEAALISSALDALKKQFGIDEFDIVGQSGGGHMAASLITLRKDILCAVPASSPSSPRIRYLMMGRTKDTTRLDSYEPGEHLAHHETHPSLKVIILGDPQDSNVFWESQVALAQALAARSIPHLVVEGQATGEQRHSLIDSARILAGLCFHGRPLDAIKDYLTSKGIKG